MQAPAGGGPHAGGFGISIAPFWGMHRQAKAAHAAALA